jgi:hypothetical protein
VARRAGAIVKISELMEQLGALQGEHGDFEVKIESGNFAYLHDVVAVKANHDCIVITDFAD